MRKLEISPVNSKSSNQVLNTENIKQFSQVWKAQRKNTPSRSRVKNYIHSKMKVTYQDNSIQEFFVWIESDGDIVIAKASDETHGEGYDLREDNSKKSFSFSNRHPSNNYTIDEIYSKRVNLLCNRRLTLSFIYKNCFIH